MKLLKGSPKKQSIKDGLKHVRNTYEKRPYVFAVGSYCVSFLFPLFPWLFLCVLFAHFAGS